MIFTSVVIGHTTRCNTIQRIAVTKSLSLIETDKTNVDSICGPSYYLRDSLNRERAYMIQETLVGPVIFPL